MKLLILILSLAACAKRDNKPEADLSLVVAGLAEKKAKYCELGRAHGEALQWNLSRCDSLLVASLWGVACGEIPLENFFSEEGQAFRTTTKDCFPGPGAYGGSVTTISKDMYRGAFLYFTKYGRLDLINKTIDYGKSKNWVMGSGANDLEVASRCVLTPGLISEAFDIQSLLVKRKLPLTESEDNIGVNTGFGAHLQVLGIIQQGMTYGGIKDSSLKILKLQAERQPYNALFQLTYKLYNPDHDVSTALAVLQGEKFPENSLPTSATRCVEHLFEHDTKDSDWNACPERNETYSGTDFVFAVSVLDGSLKKKP